MPSNIHDVAKQAGVSIGTVSRAMRGLDRVKPETRARILAAAAALHYAPSRAGASLASGRTMTIGVVVPNVTRWYFATLVQGIESACRQRGYDLLLFTLADQPDITTRVTAMGSLEKRVDAILILSLPLAGPEVDVLRRQSVPIVVLGTKQEGVGSVRVDDTLIARTAVYYLLALGHTRIAHIGGWTHDTPPFPTPRDRHTGYTQTLLAAGITPDPTLNVYGAWTVTGGATAMDQLLALPPQLRPTAVFAGSDEMAIGALAAARRHGLRIPTDLSIVGVDDHEMAYSHNLTTIAQPVPEQGRLAATILINELEGITARGEAPSHIVPTTLLVRGTTTTLSPTRSADLLPIDA
jgi:LacI family repressor for deo operon, udp, cdd, tsx, nupC, and nupG